MRKFIRVFDVILAVLLACVVTLFALPAAIRIKYPDTYREAVSFYAAETDLSPSLVFAVICTESGFRPDAVSKKGAVGLMQLLPATAQFVAGKYGFDYLENYLTDPEYNIRSGCYYLRYLFNRFSEEQTVLAAYNAGEGRVREWLKEQNCDRLKQIPYPETAAYVEKVKKIEKRYKKIYSIS